MILIFRNARLVDEELDCRGDLIVEDGRIAAFGPGAAAPWMARAVPSAGSSHDGAFASRIDGSASSPLHGAVPVGGYGAPSSEGGPSVIDATGLVLMPALVELHAHFRDPGFPWKETVESGGAAAAAGGYATVACMANTKPVIDGVPILRDLRQRAARLGAVDLYPALSFTRGMEGSDVSHLDAPEVAAAASDGELRIVSEDGKDVVDEGIFRAALRAAARLGVLASCHCDFGADEAAKAKGSGAPRSDWSRIEEDRATERALRLAEEEDVPVHIAHVSTRASLELVRTAKARAGRSATAPGRGVTAKASLNSDGTAPSDSAPRDGAALPGVLGSFRGSVGFRVSCEATPHHLLLTEEDAERLGGESFGRVNPPLRSADDRQALREGLSDGTIDAIATDHAPHGVQDKEAGAPGFTGLETALASCMDALVAPGIIDLRRLSALMSATPARLLGLADRGRIAVGLRADLALVDEAAPWIVDAEALVSRGKNSPFLGRRLEPRVVLTLKEGVVTFRRPHREPRIDAS